MAEANWQRIAAAEEPITARIRRRQEAHPVTDHTSDHEATSGAETDVQPIKEENSPGTPPMTFQERIARERKRNGEGESQSPG